MYIHFRWLQRNFWSNQQLFLSDSWLDTMACQVEICRSRSMMRGGPSEMWQTVLEMEKKDQDAIGIAIIIMVIL